MMLYDHDRLTNMMIAQNDNHRLISNDAICDIWWCYDRFTSDSAIW